MTPYQKQKQKKKKKWGDIFSLSVKVDIYYD